MSNLKKFADEMRKIGAVQDVKVDEDKNEVIIRWLAGSEYNYKQKVKKLKQKYGINSITEADSPLSNGDYREIHYSSD